MAVGAFAFGQIIYRSKPTIDFSECENPRAGLCWRSAGVGDRAG